MSGADDDDDPRDSKLSRMARSALYVAKSFVMSGLVPIEFGDHTSASDRSRSPCPCSNHDDWVDPEEAAGLGMSAQLSPRDTRSPAFRPWMDPGPMHVYQPQPFEIMVRVDANVPHFMVLVEPGTTSTIKQLLDYIGRQAQQDVSNCYLKGIQQGNCSVCNCYPWDSVHRLLPKGFYEVIGKAVGGAPGDAHCFLQPLLRTAPAVFAVDDDGVDNTGPDDEPNEVPNNIHQYAWYYAIPDVEDRVYGTGGYDYDVDWYWGAQTYRGYEPKAVCDNLNIPWWVFLTATTALAFSVWVLSTIGDSEGFLIAFARIWNNLWHAIHGNIEECPENALQGNGEECPPHLSAGSDLTDISLQSYETFDSVLHAATRVPSDGLSTSSFGDVSDSDCEGRVYISPFDSDGEGSKANNKPPLTTLLVRDPLLGESDARSFDDAGPDGSPFLLGFQSGYLSAVASAFNRLWKIAHGNGICRCGANADFDGLICRRCFRIEHEIAGDDDDTCVLDFLTCIHCNQAGYGHFLCRYMADQLSDDEPQFSIGAASSRDNFEEGGPPKPPGEVMLRDNTASTSWTKYYLLGLLFSIVVQCGISVGYFEAVTNAWNTLWNMT